MDEARTDSLYELQIAFDQVPLPESGLKITPWTVDRIFRNLLTDLTGNTHRTEICIDKMYPADNAASRLGLVELRAFEMPPHARMSLAQQLLVRTLISWFWKQPYLNKLIPWGTALHDRFMLPHFVELDWLDVLGNSAGAAMQFKPEWFAPHFEFRFPLIGSRLRRRVFTLNCATRWSPGTCSAKRLPETGRPAMSILRWNAFRSRSPGAVGDRFVVLCNGRRVPATGGRRALSGLATAIVPASQYPGPFAAGLRHRGHLVIPRHWRLHVSRLASRRQIQ